MYQNLWNTDSVRFTDRKPVAIKCSYNVAYGSSNMQPDTTNLSLKLFHMMDIGPEVSGHLTTLLWKVEKLLQNQERMLKNQEKLLQLLERHPVSTSGSAFSGGEEGLVNGSKQLNPPLQEHNLSTVEIGTSSSCSLSVANSDAPNGFTGSHCTTLNLVPSDCKLVEAAAHRIASQLSFTTEAHGSQHNTPLPADKSKNHQSTVPVYADSGVSVLNSAPVNHRLLESTLLHQKVAIQSSYASESNDLQKNSSASVNNRKTPQIAAPFEIAPSVVARNSERGNSAEDHEQVKLEQGQLKELFNMAEKIQKTSCSIGNFSVNLVKVLFSKEEIQNRNCSGTRGKTALNKNKLDLVKFCAFKFYCVPQTEQELLWKQKCVVSIDEYLRRGNRTRALSRGKEAMVPSSLSTPNIEHSHSNIGTATKTSPES